MTAYEALKHICDKNVLCDSEFLAEIQVSILLFIAYKSMFDFYNDEDQCMFFRGIKIECNHSLDENDYILFKCDKKNGLIKSISLHSLPQHLTAS